ncbi:GNAT family N-acetyltransferase [Paenibacillus psychroresistens]|uniref:GNAT family N-acetyltransferase n=1 Tax=Paenibacillus psychroresistens TaxID=1778678 RepID=A0A6B8RR83_9BACL|nr:GNAT family N-acetyltransferase [Paenibacillus psychroresistens]QGQ98479.1 GNAT family N-acetyltransferase [Paenibacillus psychroresistens]
MIIEENGIRLLRLTEEHIELVRNWRNDPKISQFMEFRDFITEEMQKKWFLSIDNKENYYFLIEYKHQLIGLTEIKKINFTDHSAEAGIFIYSEEYLNSMIPFQVTLSLLDFAFNYLNIVFINSYILKSNKRAIRFNKALGFVMLDAQEAIEKQHYRLFKDNFLLCTRKIRSVIKKEITL